MAQPSSPDLKTLPSVSGICPIKHVYKKLFHLIANVETRVYYQFHGEWMR